VFGRDGQGHPSPPSAGIMVPFAGIAWAKM
jgi:hypothetical protein